MNVLEFAIIKLVEHNLVTPQALLTSENKLVTLQVLAGGVVGWRGVRAHNYEENGFFYI